MEELTNEQAAVAAQTAEAEELLDGRNEQTTASLTKFKDVKSLEKAYNSLESEFTKRSQRIKELEGKIAELTEFKQNAEKQFSSQQKEDLPAQENLRSGDRGLSGAEEFYKEFPEAVHYAERIADFSESIDSLGNKGSLEKAYVKCLLSEADELRKKLTDEEFLFSQIEGTPIKDRVIKSYLSGVKNAPKTPYLLGRDGGSIAVLPPVKPKTLQEAGELAKDYVLKK